MSENTQLSTINSFRQELKSAHYKTLVNFMKNEESAKKFMSAVVYSVQKTPKLLECKRDSLMNAFMQCAEFWMYPSSGSGECYVIPYKDEAQFQLGYQGIVTLLYRAWIQYIRSEIIRKNDVFKYINGEIHHEIDIFKSNKDRGEAVACYVIAKVNGQEMIKVMNKEDILKFKAFSQSANAKQEWAKKLSPWNEDKDPELNMWRKTVIKQIAKTLPKSESFTKAIEQDNQDSTISESKINEMSSDDIMNEKLAWFEAQEWADKPIS